MYFKNKTTRVVVIALLLSVISLAIMSPDERYVASPALACIIMVLWLWMYLTEKDKKIPFFDAGIFCALATLIYTIYPLINFWISGLQFSFLDDYRLQSYNITPTELGIFHLRHVLYLFSFVLFYSTFRGRGNILTGNVINPNHTKRKIILFYFLLLTFYFFSLQLLTGVNYNASYESEISSANLASYGNLPLIIRQISGKLSAILFIFKLALLFIVVSRCREKKWRNILLIWIIYEVLNTFILKGSRTGLVLFILAATLLYHRMIRPFSMKFLMVSGTFLFIFFLFLGLYRSYINFSTLQSDFSQTNNRIISGNNEFQALLGTAYDVSQIKASGAKLPWYLSINDIISILPPQQLMPFEKVPAAEWYLEKLGLSGSGQGFMWGVISQSIVGFDWVELFLRGALLGFILARLHRWYIKHQSGFLETVLYIYLCIKVYYTFRDTTFSILANLVWEVLPFYLLLRLGGTILNRKTNNRHIYNTDMSSLNKR